MHKSKQRHTGQQAPPKGARAANLVTGANGKVASQSSRVYNLQKRLLQVTHKHGFLRKGSAGSLLCLNIFPSQLLLNATSHLSYFGLKMPSTDHNKL